MCDTVVATAEAAVDGVTIFGKNSDRDADEAHHLLHVLAADHLYTLSWDRLSRRAGMPAG